MPRKQSLVAPSIVLPISFAMFVSLPYFLSRASISEPPRPAAAPEVKSAQCLLPGGNYAIAKHIGYYHSTERGLLDGTGTTLCVAHHRYG